MKNILKTLMGLAIVVGLSLSFSHKSYAQANGDYFNDIQDGTSNGKLFTVGESLAKKTVGRAQQVVYGIGGLGAIALGALAFFGRFTWSWFFGLVGGLVLIAGMQLGIGYITGSGDKTFSSIVNK